MQSTMVISVGAAMVLSSTPVHQVSAQDPVAIATAAASAGAETPEGKKFGASVGEAFGRVHGTTIQGCAKGTKRPDLSNFDLFLRIGGAGVVEEALVKPSTNLATCVQREMKGWRILAPPRAGLWVKVAVNLKRK